MKKAAKSEKKRRGKIIPVVGVGLMTLTSTACASMRAADANTEVRPTNVLMAEEEVSDVSLATFHASTKKVRFVLPLVMVVAAAVVVAVMAVAAAAPTVVAVGACGHGGCGHGGCRGCRCAGGCGCGGCGSYCLVWAGPICIQ